jgi:hypothetical protein
MEKYVNQTKGLLVMLQSSLGEEELHRSAKAGEEMWEALRKVTDDHGLNVREMLNATLSVNHEILEMIDNQMKEAKKEMGLDES